MGKKHASQYANFGWLRNSLCYNSKKYTKYANILVYCLIRMHNLDVPKVYLRISV